MKRIVLLAALAAIAIPASASFADDVTGTVTVNGTVADRCLFTTGSVVLNIGEMAQAAGGNAGKLNTTSVTSQNAQLTGWCNGTAATIAVQANALTNAASAPTGFDNKVDYTATATAHPTSGDVAVSDSSTSAGASSPSTVGIFTSNIDVSFTTPASPTGGLLVAGSYTGSVVVTLSPAT